MSVWPVLAVAADGRRQLPGLLASQAGKVQFFFGPVTWCRKVTESKNSAIKNGLTCFDCAFMHHLALDTCERSGTSSSLSQGRSHLTH